MTKVKDDIVYWSQVGICPEQELHFVYVVSESPDRATGPCKVGVAGDIKKRRGNLQCGNHRPLFIHTGIAMERRPLALDVEDYCLRSFRYRRLESEWLDVSPNDVTERLISYLNADRQDFVLMEGECF